MGRLEGRHSTEVAFALPTRLLILGIPNFFLLKYLMLLRFIDSGTAQRVDSTKKGNAGISMLGRNSKTKAYRNIVRQAPEFTLRQHGDCLSLVWLAGD